MAVDRTVPNSLSAPPVAGSSYMDAVSEEISALWDVAALALTGIAGTANAITATCVPALIGNAKAGMVFSFIAASTNTGGMTLAIGATPARPLNNDAGAALAGGQIVAGQQYLILAGAAEYRVLGSSNIQKVTDYQLFTTSGTWNKPAGTPGSAIVVIEGWGAGGGGGPSATASSGGGGGSFGRRTMRAGELGASVTVTVGTSSTGAAGGSSSFGAHLVMPGGGAGVTNAAPASGGNGADLLGSGANGTLATQTGAGPDAGNGGFNAAAGASPVIHGGDGRDGGGGGGGARGTSVASVEIGGNGGRSVRGGGGGAGNGRLGGANGSGGVSAMGGAGGNVGQAGAIPAGGGGGNAPGGRGEVRIWTIG